MPEAEAREIDWRIRDVPDDGFYERIPVEPSPRRAAKLWLDNKVGRQRFAIRRFGLPLYLAHRATTRLKLPLREKVAAKITAIELAHLK